MGAAVKLRPDEVEGLVRGLFDVNEELSHGYQLRARKRGSLSVDCEKAIYFDHEAGDGGGLSKLIVLSGEVNCIEDARRWIADQTWQGHRRKLSAQKPNVSKAESRRRAQQLWAEARPIIGSPVELYLHSRNIQTKNVASLRHHPRVYNAEVGKFNSAMVASVTRLDQPSFVMAVHRTWVTGAGRKAGLKNAKKALGSTSGGGVVLGVVEDAVVIGEGIETTLSASTALTLPGIATLGTAGMTRLDLPHSIRRAVIAYDRDANGAGQRAAHMLGQRLLRQGCRVDLAAPPEGFNDFNEWAQPKAQNGKSNV